VAYLTPYIEKEKGGEKTSKGKILMATVKGDVHDIGKNIVGVVLGCNHYDVIDLGVMVSSRKIIEEAKKHNVDIIGLSGLITPSLDEMIDVAREMEKNNVHIPLLIGGATTSRVHTAVKIEKELPSSSTIHVLDASRSVPVAGKLLGNTKVDFLKEIRSDYEKLRTYHFNKKDQKTYLTIKNARRNKFSIDWENFNASKPNQRGVFYLNDLSSKEIASFIDWTPFFQTWELHGRYPRILKDEIVGEEASKLFKDAQEMLNHALKENWLEVEAVYGIWEAHTIEDDIFIFDEKNELLEVSHCLRQQSKKSSKAFNMSLSDFIAPKSSGVKDYIGAFVVTAGKKIDQIAKKFEEDLDDYNSIMIKALADRMAEAAAEYLHQKVRKEYWGYTEEQFSNEELIKEKYQGIRPAPGYPACPDHTEKETIFNLLDATNKVGVELTESLAMYPVSSVSGWYFSNPASKYFGLGKIKMDQVEELSRRKKVEVSVMKKWLSPNLDD
jgi:5-methyltetrahydrofolate--homocysteine methyltransferase